VVTTNYVHDIVRNPQHGSYPLAGIYLDNGSDLITISDNVLINTGDTALNFNDNGPGNTLTNNSGQSPNTIALSGLEPSYQDIRPGSTVADTTPPARSNGQPVGALPSGTTQSTISLSTNEAAVCRFSTNANVAYSSMTNTFASTGGTSHSTPVNGLSDGGLYSIYVRCQDSSGNANPDDFVVSFSVATAADTTLPGVAVTSPAAGATVSGTIAISAAASDAKGITRVDFYVDGVKVGTDTATPYSMTWNTATMANGSRVLSAVAYDPSNNQGVSAGVTVTVSNATALATAATPAISPSGGTYTGSVTVTISTTTSGSTIRYTTDGSTPTSSSPAYSTPFSLTASATVRAVTAKGGMNNSSVAQASFVITTNTVPAGIVDAFPFNEGSGTVTADLSTNKNVGKLVNGVSWTAQGKYSNALLFNGTSGYVNVSGPNLPTGDFTWMLWINRENVQAFQGIMEAQGTTSAELEFDLENGKVRVVSSGVTRLTSNTTVPAGAWVHLAMTRTAGVIRVYINGVLDSATGSDSRTLNFAACPMLVGVDADSGCNGSLNGYFRGTIDDVRVYSRALSQSQITSDMGVGLQP
jgi:hypothetical protein